ncbi:zinc carboxypeptidase-like [Thrips palmi]|uniref:Zinc carboxypeptidase-like n=1 Tax=Thrips palmi TaxID=161013 RepID=A0A6P8Y9S6_THRPL|nr:zinc carboxypeptidase-like [Thrips palmi]
MSWPTSTAMPPTARTPAPADWMPNSFRVTNGGISRVSTAAPAPGGPGAAADPWFPSTLAGSDSAVNSNAVDEPNQQGLNAAGNLPGAAPRAAPIYAWLERLAVLHAGLVDVVRGGRSFEGRPIKGVRLFPGKDKPRLFIEAGMHAQEWITTSTACWLIHRVLQADEADAAPWSGLARAFEWHVFPNVNPDGYEYSFKTERAWRKTRSKGLVCYGVDGNRNWAYGWNPGNSTTRHPCARNFPGRAPFCEAETRGLSEYVRSLAPGARLRLYVSLHSSKQMILFPWGCSREHSADHEELMEIGQRAASALERVHGTKFQVGPIASTIYMAPGNSVDWVYAAGVKYAFAMELRNPVKPEQYVSASAIEATGEETFAAIITMLEEVASRSSRCGK